MCIQFIIYTRHPYHRTWLISLGVEQDIVKSQNGHTECSSLYIVQGIVLYCIVCGAYEHVSRFILEDRVYNLVTYHIKTE